MEIEECPGNFDLKNSIKILAIIHKIIEESIGFTPIITPKITPAKEVWERASPITEIFLFTITIPIKGITNAKRALTINALCKKSYCNSSIIIL